jgi:lysophospholipase L1-like esterase
MNLLKNCISTMLLLSCGVAGAASSDFYLHNGDRVVFYGDSITEQRMYTEIVETYALTRYPGLNVTFVNSGWGGDTVRGGGGGPIDNRLQRDVFPYRPTVMTIMLGMNDGGYKAETAANDEIYFTGYRHIVQSVRAALPEIRITAIEPSPYDDVTGHPAFPVNGDLKYNQVLISYGKWIADYAPTEHLDVADLNSGVVATLEKAEKLNPQEAVNIIPGHVHPSFAGHMLMAEELLKSWNARPVVSALTIDASKQSPRIALADHTVVTGLSRGAGIQWTALDDALPLPFVQWQGMWGGGAAIGLVLQGSDMAKALNEQPLRILGLKEGVYSLQIDGSSVGSFNNDELAVGINLALLKTPMSDQAMKVYQLTVNGEEIHFDRWRNIQVPLAEDLPQQVQQATASLDGLNSAVVQLQHETAKPKPHTFALIRIQ